MSRGGLGMQTGCVWSGWPRLQTAFCLLVFLSDHKWTERQNKREEEEEKMKGEKRGREERAIATFYCPHAKLHAIKPHLERCIYKRLHNL